MLKRAGPRAHLYGEACTRPSLRLRFLPRVGVVRSVFIVEVERMDASDKFGKLESGVVGLNGLGSSSSGDTANPAGDGENDSGGVCAL